MKYVNVYEFNKAIAELEQAIADSRFIKVTPQAYQRTADELREKADYLAGLIESEIITIDA